MLELAFSEADRRQLADEISPYLLLKPRILRDACQTTQRDDDGRGCASCCVRRFCESQARLAPLSDQRKM